MRIHKLTIAGFGPYRGEHTVDFDEFAGDIFLIDGKTGAGKSSILDAIVYALYNTVPRYDVSGAAKVRSDFCGENDPTFVELEFSIRGERYRVKRNPDYRGPGGKGGRVVNVGTNAQLWHNQGADWIATAEKPREVGLALAPILVLNADQFLQVIMLAQNKFSEFLNAKSEERASILSAVFRTSRFSAVQEEFKRRADALDAQLADASRVRDALADRARGLVRDLNFPAEMLDEPLLDETLPDATWFAALITLVERAHITTRADLDERKATLKAAGDHRDELTKKQTTFKNLKSAQETASAEAERRPVMDAQRARVELAERAERVRPDLETVTTRRAARERDEAQRDTEFAQALADGALDESIGTDVTKLTASAVTKRADALKKVITSLDEAHPQQDELTAKSAAKATAQEKLRVAEEEKGKLDLRVVEFPALKHEASERAAKLSNLVARIPDLETASKKANEQFSAVKKREDLVTQLARAEKSEQKASKAATDVAAVVDDLLTRRNEGMAFVLAKNLAPGEACAVCGSVEHPAPARSEAHIPEADEISDAQERRSELELVRDEATARVAALREEKSAAEVVAGDLTLETAEPQVSASQRELADALTARDHLKDAAESLERLDEEIERTRARLTELTGDIATLNTTIKNLTKEIDAGLAKLDELRGEHDTLTARREAEQDRVDALGELLDAVNAVATAVNECAAAEKALTASLASNAFDTIDAVQDALLDPDELARLRDEVTTFAAELDAAKKLLEDAGAGAEVLVDVSDELANANAAYEEQNEAVRQRDTEVTWIKTAAGHLRDIAKNVDEHDSGNAELFARRAMMRELADLTSGRGSNAFKMRLETFVLAARLEDIMVKANERLAKMTGGQYELKHDDGLRGNAMAGLGIQVLDNWTGVTRESQSLSGGETFLASMALAFGLAEVVSENAGGIQLDTLFIDEGFAALDNEILDTAMNTLQDLRATGRTIGLISHVGPMKEQIPNKIHVAKGNDGTSVITVHHG